MTGRRKLTETWGVRKHVELHAHQLTKRGRGRYCETEEQERAFSGAAVRARAFDILLQNGQLLDTWALSELAKPVTDTRGPLQQQVLADYHARRDTAVDAQLRTLGRWARRRADPAADAAAYDEHLLVCDVCAIAVPDPDDPAENGGDDLGDWLPGPHRRLPCDHCGTGRRRPGLLTSAKSHLRHHR